MWLQKCIVPSFSSQVCAFLRTPLCVSLPPPPCVFLHPPRWLGHWNTLTLEVCDTGTKEQWDTRKIEHKDPGKLGHLDSRRLRRQDTGTMSGVGVPTYRNHVVIFICSSAVPFVVLISRPFAKLSQAPAPAQLAGLSSFNFTYSSPPHLPRKVYFSASSIK